MKKTNNHSQTANIKLWHILLILFLLILSIILPALLLLPKQKPPQASLKQNLQQLNEAPQIKVLFEDGVKEISLEEYLLGVISAEMPAAFPIAALEAQAISARTYIYIHSPLNPAGDNSRHPDAAVCCDSTHCQAWQDETARKEKWGENAPVYEEKIRQAIANTWGMLITYKGKPVEAPYFSSCGGQTESAAWAWGRERDWLKSVECQWDKEAPVYETEAVFTLAEAANKLGVKTKDISNMTVLEKTAGGRIASLSVGNKTYKGTEIRQLLGLRSACFSWEIAQKEILFSVHGYGHGVGLCQYGAGGMAKAGYNYEEIIKHYYSGVEIQKAY